MVDLICLTSVCYLPWMLPDPPQCHLCKYIYIYMCVQSVIGLKAISFDLQCTSQ